VLLIIITIIIIIIIIIINVLIKGWVKEGSNNSNGMCYFKYFPYCKLSISDNFVASGRKFHPYKVQWDTRACNWNISNWRNIEFARTKRLSKT
jgi:hypothetical protein